MEEEVEREAVEEFISRDVILSCLMKYTGKEITEISPLNEVVIEPATRRIEGSTSSVYRFKIGFRAEGKAMVQTKSFMIKRLPQSEVRQQIVQTGGLFRREVFFFDKVVPYMKTIGGRRMAPPVPDGYYAVSDNQENLIVMEDPFDVGYRSPQAPMNDSYLLEHCLLVMRRLGQLHGFSYGAERTMTKKSKGWLGMEPSLEKDLLFYETVEGDERQPSHAYGMLLGSIDVALDLAGDISERAAAAAAAGELAGILEGAWSTVCQLVSVNPKASNVLCHGDCWINNVLFRYDKSGGEERLVDAKFMDFQLSRYGHPCLDIVYFLYLSTNRAIRKKHINEIMLAYYNSLVDTLSFLGKGSPPITLAELRHDLLFKYKAFGIIMAFMLKPVLSLDPEFVSEHAPQNGEEEGEEPAKGSNYHRIMECYENNPAYKKGLVEVLEEAFELLIPIGSQ
ncbi:uncharacterized protein [Hetaerina americana]|uniref:uncharacterized protein n=1 Tax=Hetaerina americana TaxID=62018 RepID=UPI003A7F5CC2